MKSTGSDDSTTARNRFQRPAVLVLLALGLVMFASDPYFTFLDDEVQIISAAARPLAQTIGLYLHGAGQFEHPPLYDLLLHGWLQMTGGRLRLLRWPSIAFYIVGIGFLATTGRKLAGDKAARSVLWVSVLWPFGFHFGRLAAWYSLSFLLVAILTYRYLVFLGARTLRNWLLAIIPAILLLYTCYFGWAILACLLFDYGLEAPAEARQHWPRILCTLLLLVAAFLPLAPAFFAAMARAAENENSVVGRASLGAFNVYALFASESVAPWYWTVGIPVAIAVAACAVAVLLYAPASARRLFIYLLLLVALMSLLGIIGTKRLLLISAWAVLPVGLCLGTLEKRQWRGLLITSLLVVAGAGWFGTVARRYYAAPHFVEPWRKIAVQMAKAVRRGDAVIATHPSLFFYLTYELHATGRGSALDLAEAWPYQIEGRPVYTPWTWQAKGRPLSPHVYVVRDVSSGNGVDDAEAYLARRCTLEDVTRLLLDSGFNLKERFLPAFPQVRYRIEVRRYACAP